MKKIVPINTDGEGNAKTMLAGYYKFGCATLLGDTFGSSGTAILEIYEDSIRNQSVKGQEGRNSESELV